MFDPIIYLPFEDNLNNFINNDFVVTRIGSSTLFSSNAINKESFNLNSGALECNQELPISKEFTICLFINPSRMNLNLSPVIEIGSSKDDNVGLCLAIQAGSGYGEYSYGMEPYGGWSQISIVYGNEEEILTIPVEIDIRSEVWVPLIIRQSETLQIYIGMSKIFDMDLSYKCDFSKGFYIGKSYQFITSFIGLIDNFYLFNRAISDDEFQYFFPKVFRLFNKKTVDALYIKKTFNNFTKNILESSYIEIVNNTNAVDLPKYISSLQSCILSQKNQLVENINNISTSELGGYSLAKNEYALNTNKPRYCSPSFTRNVNKTKFSTLNKDTHLISSTYNVDQLSNTKQIDIQFRQFYKDIFFPEDINFILKNGSSALSDMSFIQDKNLNKKLIDRKDFINTNRNRVSVNSSYVPENKTFKLNSTKFIDKKISTNMLKKSKFVDEQVFRKAKLNDINFINEIKRAILVNTNFSDEIKRSAKLLLEGSIDTHLIRLLIMCKPYKGL